jgi:carbamoyltransferase
VYQQFVHQTISNHLGIPKDRIHHFDHHSCHAAYAYWASPLRGADVMVLTADAFGDGLSLTVSLPDKSGGLERVHSISHDDFTLARLYRYITLVLGMKPNEHEYKVMGLAPYAKEAILKPALEIFRQHMYVDGIDVKFREKPKDYYYWFKEKLEGLRFDAIAGGLQRYTEEIMSELVRNSMRRFGAKRLVFSGGISMNVKANMLLKDLEEVDAMFVPPSGGDESLAMGVCYAYADSVLGNRDLNPLTHAYLGPSITPSEPKQLAQTAKNDGFQVYRANNQLCAELLAKNWIIGRCSGPMEFGARSLGNRAIIANPRKREIVDVINFKIKNRDFWMPFAPSILAEYADNYLVNPKHTLSPFMTIGFESTTIGREMLEAATHPADKTLRPNIVSQENNPQYHALIIEFAGITGIGGVLNTSFNLHGEPIVANADDAYRVFQLTDIDALLVEDVLVTKNSIS